MLKLTALLLLALPLSAQQAHDTVVVTGTYEPIPLQESDRDVHLEKVSPARTLVLNSPTDLLQLDSSADLQERAPSNIQSDISLRGTNFGQTLILLDGLRINDAQTAHHNLDIPLPLTAIGDVEILKGSGSTQYGSDAIGGVINIVPRVPEADDFTVRMGLGNFGTNQERADGSLILGPLSELVSFSRDFSTGFIPDRDYRDLQFGSNSHLKLPFGAANVTLGYADRPFGADQFYGDYDSWERTKVWFAGLRQTLGEQTELSFGYRRHSDLFVLYREDPRIFTNRHVDQTEQLAVRRWEKLATNTRLHYGGELLHDSIDSNNLGQHSRTRGSGFVALDVRALNRFAFSLGAREEVYASGETQFSPSATAGYWLTAKLRIHGSATHAFRLPTYTDLYYHDPGNVGNPNLKPERAWDFEGAADYDFSRHLRASVTIFELRERDVIDYVRADPDAVYVATNFDKLNFTGVEARMKFHGLSLSYTGLHGGFHASQVVESKYTAYYPVDEAVAAWEGGSRGMLFRTRLGVLQRYRQDAYALWDLYAAYTKRRVHPYFQMTNATNTVYYEVAGVLMPSRAVMGGLEFSLRKR